MRRAIPQLLAGALLLTTALAELSAAPAVPVNFKVATLIDSGPESLDHPRPYIAVGDRKICFEQPPFSQLSSSADSLNVYLSKPGVMGQFTVINSPFKPDVDLIAQVDGYVRAGEATIPTDAADVKFEGGSDRVYVINRWKSNTLNWSYKLHGRMMHRQIAYLNIDPEHQICLTVVCDEESAAATFSTAKSFVNSWFWADLLK